MMVSLESSLPEAGIFAEIEAAATSYPWTAGNYADSMKSGHLFYLLREQETIQGFAIIMLVAGEAEVLNLVISQPYQGQGLGSVLLNEVITSLTHQNCSKLFLEVRKTNLAALSLYKKCLFEQSGLRKNYYQTESGREDAILMEREL